MRGEQHLRPREQGEQGTSAVELLFDLVYVFAVTQLSHLLIGQLTLAGAGRTLFLLGVVWWAWIYTTWMVNWYDPASTAVRLVLVAGGLASLLMAAAIPGAFGTDGALFAGAYVALQVGRNLAAAALLERSHALRRTYERILAWSALSGALWIAGGLGPAHLRFAFWGPALAVDLIAPALGYRTPGLGASSTSDYPVEGGHFAERFQAFIIIALGESIVVTGATASARGLSSGVVWSLGVAFLGTSALWWLYFGEVAEHSRRQLAGIIAVAVGNDILISHPHRVLSLAGALTMLGGPALYLFGESMFRLRMIGSVSPKRIGTVIALCALGMLAAIAPAIAVSAAVAAVLSALAIWEWTGTAAAERAVS